MKVFCGPFQPSLEDAFAERIRELAAAGRRVAVVTPSRRLAERLQALLALEKGLSLLGARFHTFYSLALEILDAAGLGEDHLVADGLFHDKIVDRLLASEPRRTRGLAGAFRSSIRDLVDAGVDPGHFQEHFPDLLAEGPEKDRLFRLLAVQEGYLKALRTMSVLAPSGMARLAAETVLGGKGAALGKYDEVLYYGFYDLTGAQAEFFEAVARNHPSSVFFPYRKGHPAFRFADRFFAEKLHAGGAPEQLEPRVETRALGEALDRLFVPAERAPLKDPSALRVINVSGTRDELWVAAKEINRLHEGPEAVPFSDIGIVARSLEPYRSLAPEVLKEHAIPHHMEAGDPLLRHPVAQLALALLTLRKRGFPATAVLDIIGSECFRYAGKRSLVADWTRLITRNQVHGGWPQWEGRIQPWTREEFELYPELAAEGERGESIPKEAAALLWSWLCMLRERLQGPAGGGWAAMAAHAQAMLEENFSVREEDPSFPAWQAALAAIDGLRVFDLAAPMGAPSSKAPGVHLSPERAAPEATWEEFLEALEEAWRRAALGAGPQRGGVRVLSAMDARGESFRVLFLIGLQDGRFPRQVSPDPLLPDGVRNKLRAGGYGIMPKLEGEEEERLLFYLLAASVSERLYCVYQRSDDDGKAVVPSLFLQQDLCRACGRDLDDARFNERVPRQPFSKMEALDFRDLTPKEASVFLSRAGRSSDPALQESLDAVRTLNRLKPGPGAMDGIIGRDEDFLRRLKERGLSPSALQSFCQCPFKFFASRLLRLEEDEGSSDMGDVSSQFRGKLYHAVLERFYRRRRETPDAALEESLEAELPEGAWRRLGLYPVLWEATRRRLASNLRRVVARDLAELAATGFAPSYFEAELSAEVEGLRLHGRVDRIDLDARGKRLRVIDYKSTWRKGGLVRFVEKMKGLQPPLYLELAGAWDRAAGYEIAGARYYALEDSEETTGEKSVQEFPAEDWRRLRRKFLANIATFVKLMGRGSFLITPDEERGGACEYCDFASVCRKSHVMTRRRAEGSAIRRQLDRSRTAVEPAAKPRKAKA